MTEDQKLVICVEDELEMIDLFKLVLNRKGYEVIGTFSGRQAIDLIKEKQPVVVLLDLMMPDMDGWEVYQHLKADPITKNIPVIIVTARAQNIDKVLGLHIAKVDDYISKPFSPQDLLDSIENVINRD